MLYTFLCRAGLFGTAIAIVALLASFGPMHSPPSDQNGRGEATPAKPEVIATSAPYQDSQHANGNARQSVRDRLAEIKSKQELIEKNKRFPMLHQDATEFLDSVEVVATGYYAGRESTGKSPGHPQYGITFSGVKVKQDILSTIAADPKVFPLGTILYIPGYGYGIVADTGSAIKGNKIDLYYETKDQIYKEWGKRTVRVFVVRNGNGKVSETTLQQWNDILSVVAAQQDSPLEL